ncbi:hypothetical protein GOP47_0024327 [Adiantum capillus-veneris]|uniref:BHLH domain-containing protein n=1 Tax=Adiantum capillus-veneris TaxID=13818 RepID=A0A9D4U2F1_ADICA|nr:hypothetical protein GOP47_0024327 [Adiantum capillus-veneris]
MSGVELSGQQTGMGLPFGMARQAEFTDDRLLKVDGTLSDNGTPSHNPTTWPVPPASASPSALQKMLADLSYGHHIKSEVVPPHPHHYPPLGSPSVPHVQDQVAHANPYSAAFWVRQLQGSLPQECYSSFAISGPKDPARPYPHPISLNGGSLVLDTARGELVNASKMTPKEILEAKALAASKSHSEAERRRRERINTHLATLRTLLPSSTKTDKASLLAEVIDQVKTLKRQVSEIYEYGPMPTDHDDISIEKVASGAEGRLVIRASLCCDDRPELMNDLKEAIDGLRLRTLKAEISTLGGRIKNVFVMTLKDEAVESDEDVFIKRFREALRTVMDGPGGGELSPGSSNKRQRVSPYEAPPACG